MLGCRVLAASMNLSAYAEMLAAGRAARGNARSTPKGRAAVAGRAPSSPPGRPTIGYLMCLLTSLVISNIETLFLPPNTGRACHRR